jgi:hypothetical protein
LYFDFALEGIGKFGVKLLLEILSEDNNNLAKSGSDRIIDTIFQDCLSVRSEAVDLFESAIARSHSAGEYEEGWFHKVHKIDKIGLHFFG